MSIGAQLIKYLAAVLSMVPILLAALLVGIVHRRSGWRIARLWSRTVAAIFGIEVRVEQECDDRDLDAGGVMVGLTQQSLLDPTLAFVALDRHWLAIWSAGDGHIGRSRVPRHAPGWAGHFTAPSVTTGVELTS
jgi:1-acyl-sn-glycerol-3-phosphate acyltransferase